jgi:predicted phage gp36 major capsid-like protein
VEAEPAKKTRKRRTPQEMAIAREETRQRREAQEREEAEQVRKRKEKVEQEHARLDRVARLEKEILLLSEKNMQTPQRVRPASTDSALPAILHDAGKLPLFSHAAIKQAPDSSLSSW